MDREDRIKIDQAKDKLLQILTKLRELRAGYGEEVKNTTNDLAKRQAKSTYGLLGYIIDLYEVASGQVDQINKQSETILHLRAEIEELKIEIQKLKK